MTPKEKALEIYYKFTVYAPLHNDNKHCALIAVDEILQSHYELLQGIKQSTYDYYLEVKREISKL